MIYIFRKCLFLSFAVVICLINMVPHCYSEESITLENRYAPAILKYEQELTENPNNADSQYKLGLYYYAVGENRDAIQKLKIAKELYLSQGNFSAALQAEQALNTLTVKEAFELIQKRVNELTNEVEEIKGILKDKLGV